jgi:hypothetical protein
MTEVLSPPEPVRGRPFVKGRSGNPTGRRYGSSNKKTLTAAVLLDGEAEALTRKAAELALAGGPDGAAALHRKHSAAAANVR